MLDLAPGRFALEGLVPARVARPDSVAKAATLLADAHRDGLAVIPWGGGTHQELGNLPTRYDLALDLRGLEASLDHQPADMILTVGAGMTLASVQAVLAGVGQMLPLEAEDPTRATIGGLLASRSAGPLRLGYGTARDFTLWVEALQADGTRVHGGAKVVKNVAGYDMTKLYLGSLGSVGVLMAACFKVLPIPQARPTVLLGFEEPGAASEVLATLASGRLLPSLVTMVHGPARWGEPFGVAPWVLALGADGPADTTAWQVERFFGLGQAAGCATATSFAGEDSLAIRQGLMTHRGEGAVRLAMMVLPGQVALVLEALAYLPGGAPQAVFAEASSGVVRASWARAGDSAALHPWRDAARLASDLGGRWVLEACPTAWKRGGLDVWGEAAGDRPLMRRLKSALDPRGVRAPGRFAGG